MIKNLKYYHLLKPVLSLSLRPYLSLRLCLSLSLSDRASLSLIHSHLISKAHHFGLSKLITPVSQSSSLRSFISSLKLTLSTLISHCQRRRHRSSTSSTHQPPSASDPHRRLKCLLVAHENLWSSPTHPFCLPSSPTLCLFVIGDFLFCL